MERLASPAHKELKDLTATCPPSTTIMNVNADIALMVHLAHPAPLERKVNQESLAEVAQLETTPRTAHPDHLAMQDNQDLKEKQARMALRDHLARTEAKAARVSLAQLAQSAQLAPREIRARMAEKDRREDRAVTDLLDQLEKLDQLARMATQDHLVQMGHQARTPHTVPAPSVPSSTRPRPRRTKQTYLRFLRTRRFLSNWTLLNISHYFQTISHLFQLPVIVIIIVTQFSVHPICTR